MRCLFQCSHSHTTKNGKKKTIRFIILTLDHSQTGKKHAKPPESTKLDYQQPIRSMKEYLTCAFGNCTILKSPKLSLLPPKLSEFESLVQIMSNINKHQNCHEIPPPPPTQKKKKKSKRENPNTSSLFSAFGPISTTLKAFSIELTETPTSNGSLSNIEKPWSDKLIRRC